MRGQAAHSGIPTDHQIFTAMQRLRHHRCWLEVQTLPLMKLRCSLKIKLLSCPMKSTVKAYDMVLCYVQRGQDILLIKPPCDA